jgi:predicted dehydrogenase
LVSSPWETHTPVAVAAMRAGKHVAVEVPAAVSTEQCWELVDTSEATRRHCVMLENCCYGRSELAVLNMVRQGMFGELLHAEAAYIHDLRRILMTNQWRRQWHTRLNGNLYPTHGLGPVATYLDINRGDRFTSLVSLSTRTTSAIQDWAKAHPAEPIAGDPAAERYVTGDINTSILATAGGRTVLLQHQVVGPRPYDRRNLIVGTNGAFSDYPPRIYLEDRRGLSGFTDQEEYVDLAVLADQVDHELWRAGGERAARIGGHGGMDYLMLLRLTSAMREGAPPDMDVYDAATWSAPIGSTAASVAQGGSPVEIPDFTRGDWCLSRPGIP